MNLPFHGYSCRVPCLLICHIYPMSLFSQNWDPLSTAAIVKLTFFNLKNHLNDFGWLVLLEDANFASLNCWSPNTPTKPASNTVSYHFHITSGSTIIHPTHLAFEQRSSQGKNQCHPNTQSPNFLRSQCGHFLLNHGLVWGCLILGPRGKGLLETTNQIVS